MRLTGKTALITGAGSGIGRETALLFSQEGASIVAVDVNLPTAQETVQLIQAAGGRATAFQADVSHAAECEAMIRHAEDNFGALHVLFNNAGIMHSQDDDAVNTEEAIWDLTMAINLKGVWLGCKYGIPALRRAGGGTSCRSAGFGRASIAFGLRENRGGRLNYDLWVGDQTASGRRPCNHPVREPTMHTSNESPYADEILYIQIYCGQRMPIFLAGICGPNACEAERKC